MSRQAIYLPNYTILLLETSIYHSQKCDNFSLYLINMYIESQKMCLLLMPQWKFFYKVQAYKNSLKSNHKLFSRNFSFELEHLCECI